MVLTFPTFFTCIYTRHVCWVLTHPPSYTLVALLQVVEDDLHLCGGINDIKDEDDTGGEFDDGVSDWVDKVSFGSMIKGWVKGVGIGYKCWEVRS